MGLFKSAGRAIKKAGKQFTQNARNSGSTFQAIGTLGAAPVSIALGSVGAGLKAARPVLSEATGILAENPALAGLAGSALGVPGLGGLFGGGMPAGGDVPTGGMFTPAPASIPTWLWIVGGIAAALGLFLLFRRKS